MQLELITHFEQLQTFLDQFGNFSFLVHDHSQLISSYKQFVSYSSMALHSTRTPGCSNCLIETIVLHNEQRICQLLSAVNVEFSDTYWIPRPSLSFRATFPSTLYATAEVLNLLCQVSLAVSLERVKVSTKYF